MAKNKSFFGTLITLGGLAAVAAAAYQRRDEIKKVVTDAANRWFPDEPEEVDYVVDEADVIIDRKEETETVEEPTED